MLAVLLLLPEYFLRCPPGRRRWISGLVAVSPAGLGPSRCPSVFPQILWGGRAPPAGGCVGAGAVPARPPSPPHQFRRVREIAPGDPETYHLHAHTALRWSPAESLPPEKRVTPVLLREIHSDYMLSSGNKNAEYNLIQKHREIWLRRCGLESDLQSMELSAEVHQSLRDFL